MADALLAWLAALPPWAVYLSLMALSALENVFPPVPADVAVALGGFLSQQGVVGAPLLGLLCWLANLSTAALTYAAGRIYGPGFFESGWPARLLPPEAMAALREAYARHGMAGIFVSRFLPGIRAGVTPFAGVAGMPAWKALLPAGLASAIWYALLVSAGAALGLEWGPIRSLIERLNHLLGLLALAVAAALALWLWRARGRAPRN